MYTIDYSSTTLAIHKGEAPELPTNTARVTAATEDDFAGMNGELLLRVLNAVAGTSHVQLPPDPGQACWFSLEGHGSFPIVLPAAVPPAKESKKITSKKAKKGLQPSPSSTTSSSSEGAPASDEPTKEADMAAKKKTAAKKNAAPTNGDASKVRTISKTSELYRLKTMVIKNPAITNDQLKAKGVAMSDASIATFRQDFVHSLRVLKEEGFKVPVPG